MQCGIMKHEYYDNTDEGTSIFNGNPYSHSAWNDRLHTDEPVCNDSALMDAKIMQIK